MGQPVTVIEKPSSRVGIVRYEVNRVLTGMGHERYRSAEDAVGPTPADELARRLFARGGVASVHVNSNVVTLQLDEGDTSGITDIIRDLYTYYVPGVEPPSDEELMGDDAPAAE